MFDLKEEYYYKGEMDEPFMIKQKKNQSSGNKHASTE